MTMKEPKDFYNDPQLTAYALGELEGDERAAVEAVLKTDPAARAVVDEIRATAKRLEAALAAEPMPQIKSITAPLVHRAAIMQGRDPGKLDGGPLPNLIKFPRAYFLIAGLAAACFAVMVTLHESQVEEQRKAAIEAMQMAEDARHQGSMKSAMAATAKPSPYTEVTFPVAAIPVGKVETQSQPQTVATDKTAGLGTSIAANQPADVETVKLQASDAAAAPAPSYAAAETTAGARETSDIAGVNNSVAYDFSSRATPDGFNTEAEADQAGGDFVSVAQNPLSTFGLDVGTASYANVRRFLQAGKRPPADAVYIAELVNYFPYAYAAPRDHAPLAATLEVAGAPWAPAHRLVRIGLKAREVPAGGTPVTVAKDVTVQVEFNPAQVQMYRLIGYEGHTLKKKDFSKDAITAGDLGAGHTVTALYEIVPVGVEPPGGDALKYEKVVAEGERPEVGDRKAENLKSEISNPEILTLKVHYTPIEGGAGRQLEFPLTDRGATFAEASMDFKFAAAVAAFGLILRDSPLKGSATLSEVEQWAGQGLGPDAGGYRAEFIGLVHQAEKLKE
jgi:anti-sigma factor RsiW